jgi:formylglycine-generating enzyme
VGDAGNFSDGRTNYGAVHYVYQIGKYDVTVGQYCQFLNAVAGADPYGLYNSNMAPSSPTGLSLPTIGISQSWSLGTYHYSVAGSYSQAANCPIFDVSWADAARFCNWLQNGQPTGPEGTGTTETGAYTLINNPNLMAIARNAGARYFIPTENEWYKAAYFKSGSLLGNYWSYPTKSDNIPSNVLLATGTNNANFPFPQPTNYTDPVNLLTPVGAFAASPGPYGTFDMGGDVMQWTEAAVTSDQRGLLGGSFGNGDGLQWFHRDSDYPMNATPVYGFRVAGIPEPSSITLLLVGAASLFAYACRRRRQAV